MLNIVNARRPVTTGGLIETAHAASLPDDLLQLTSSISGSRATSYTLEAVPDAELHDEELQSLHPNEDDDCASQFDARSTRTRTPIPAQSAKTRLLRTPSASRSQRGGRSGKKDCRRVADWMSARINGRREKTRVPEDSFVDADSDYDTDLEEEVSEERDYMTCRHLYMKTCKMYDVVPQASFLRNMNHAVLEIKHHCIGPDGLKAMAVPLQINTHITSLNLEGNWIGCTGAKHLAYMLGENTYISDLNVAWNRLGSEGASLLCEGVKGNPNIQRLDISGNGFQDKDAGVVASLIQSNTTITNLNLSHNEFRESGAIQLGKAIGLNDTIETLNLSWNHIRLKGADAVAKGIKVNTNIKMIDLSMNGFGENGAISLAAALTVNSCLVELDISSNRINAPGCRAIAKAIAKNTTITRLEMGLNPITFAGALDLIRAIETNTESPMEFLDLTGAVVKEDFMQTARDIQAMRRFDTCVGFVSKSKDLEEGDIAGVSDKNPLEILLMFMSEKRMRLVDLFQSLDKDKSGSLERHEFIEGLQAIETPLSEAQLDELILMLDKDGDGEIEFSEIMNINKEFKDIRMKAAQKAKEIKAKAKLKAAINIIKVAQAMTQLTEEP